VWTRIRQYLQSLLSSRHGMEFRTRTEGVIHGFFASLQALAQDSTRRQAVGKYKAIELRHLSLRRIPLHSYLIRAASRTFVLALLLSDAATVEALVVREYDPSRHERFSTGFPLNPVRNDSFFLSDFDFSGVGWVRDASAKTNLTLISPQHFVGAAHTRFFPGLTVDFLNRLGELKSYTVSALHTIPNADGGRNSDLFIGTLSEPIPVADEIGFYPLLRLPQESDYEAQPVIVYGEGGRVGTGVIDSVYRYDLGITAGMHVANRFTDLISGGPDDAYQVSADTGSPSFVVADGRLALVGTMSVNVRTGNPVLNQDMFVPRYLDSLNDEMASTPFRVTTIPSSAAEVREITLEFIPDGSTDVLARARFVGTLPFDRLELQSLVITPEGSAALTTGYGTQLPAGEYSGTFNWTRTELAMDVTGTSLIDGSLSSQDAPDRFGGNTGYLTFGRSSKVCTIGGACIQVGTIGFWDGQHGTTIGDPLASVSLNGRWVNVVPEPSSSLLILMLSATVGAVARRRHEESRAASQLRTARTLTAQVDRSRRRFALQ
jgi:hypothetical protein